ncbi:uncharacterized protein PITG_02451 [Phytophthora infestans T30-4]|uniref:Spt20-like SEP domain-containing protein n=1 Tax=Phytophthora infestans (strain T30-4) TaxID=403677 RepID=D0MWC7_PHYIT|nr:uncharacterized protein PITG_02451 [Phytophthora infestans T30-4]EEY63940.1 hypothetical protein PITG_02451 [Phytophthora infestans T30-4]|eukprot:XP_002907376.1 hypothetical protein PITG_02451 [Phytophthora infestans T30-4]
MTRITEDTTETAEQPVGLVLALFYDGFVCRHMTKENEGVEGFAQPYDAESSYFLACIDNGRVPEGLPEMIACAHYNGSVVAEIRDYRELRTALCPPPTLQSMFDHFPDVHPSELETLAVDAKRQLLQEEDVLLSSSSTESSSPPDDGPTRTPTTRSRWHSRSETSPPASLLSPIQRKSARSTLIGQEETVTKRCKRHIRTKVKGSKLLGEHTAQITPLPATQLFLSKLKGKRRRPDGNELLYGKPAWVTIAHVGRFFRAATRLEREHSRFLHHVAGSMRYLARQLGDLSRPSDVIAVASARDMRAAEDEGRELRAPDWVDIEEQSPSPTNIVDNASLIGDYQPTAATPHFNAFDEDGNLQLQSA